MRLEVLVSTMNRSNVDFIKKMNINGNCVVINQSNYEDYNLIDNKIKLISNKKRGLSISRNEAINNSTADICIIADDDVTYNNSYEEIIRDAYMRYPDADIIAFYVNSINKDRPTSRLKKEGYINFIDSMKIASFQITFKRKSFIDNNIKFNEKFGAGSKYKMGEENILLFECFKKKLKIVYCNKEIGIVNHEESTWFNGYSKKYFNDMGAIYYEMSNYLYSIFIIQYAIRKYKLYKKSANIIQAIKWMFEGKKIYIREDLREKYV